MRRILHIDLTTGTSSTEEATFPAIHGLGGKALALELLERHLDPHGRSLLGQRTW